MPVRDAILPNLKEFFVINADICSSFPLEQLTDLHSKHRGVGTIMGVKVRAVQSFLVVEGVKD